MTSRQQLERQLNKWWPPYLLASACILLVIALLIAPVFNLPKPLFFGPVILVLAVVHIFGLCLRAARCCCPSCRKNLACEFGPDGFSDSFRHCPSCGFDLEQEIGTADAAIRRP